MQKTNERDVIGYYLRLYACDASYSLADLKLLNASSSGIDECRKGCSEQPWQKNKNHVRALGGGESSSQNHGKRRGNEALGAGECG